MIGFGFGFASDWMNSNANFLSQSCCIVDAKPITLRHSNENRYNNFIVSSDFF